jgi:hypothetical protein
MKKRERYPDMKPSASPQCEAPVEPPLTGSEPPPPVTSGFFAAMDAGMEGEGRPDMEPVPRPVLPDRQLSAESDRSLTVPAAHDKLDSAKKLRARVAVLRRHYAPFLRDRTPPHEPSRPRLDLRAFDFRLETREDRADGQRPYADTGDWEEVTIPHYRGPVGSWAGYYRTAFRVPSELLAPGRVWLRFDAVDYTATVFVNGVFVGRHEGMFAPFEFDITDLLRTDRESILLVRVENDAIQMGNELWRPWQGYGAPVPDAFQVKGDKVYGGTGQGWDAPDGWTHCPPGAGIWQPVYLEGRHVTSIHDLFVRPLPSQSKAELWLETYGSAPCKRPVSVGLTVYPNNFEGDATELGRHALDPAGPKVSLYRISFDLPGFRWWTPEAPHLYTLRVRLACEESGGSVEDVRDVVFGMRSFVQDTVGSRKGTFYLNGTEIILRGTNEMGNLSVPIQQGNIEQAVEDLLIGKAAHINYWRMTQRPIQPRVYDLCDRLGVLFQTDLPMFAGMRHSCMEETARQAGEMERLVRAHPAAVVSSFINEPFPATWKQHERHRFVDRVTLEDFFEVCTRYTRLYNPDRVIKCVDGDYDPPPRHGMLDQHAYVCMHEDHGIELGKLHGGELFRVKKGWRCGVGEYGAEGMEPLATMRRHYPAAWLPQDDDDRSWTPDRIPMCQAWGWHHQWYDRQDTIGDWIAATHRHQAWAVRFMHEGFRRRADIIGSTVIHLLVNAWPNNWLKALCSVDREPLPAFFAYADANMPLAVNLRTDRHAVTGGEPLDVDLWVLNDKPTAPNGARIVYWIECDDAICLINQCAASVSPLAAAFQGRLRWRTPVVDAPTALTIRASLLAADDTILHDCCLALTLWPKVDYTVLAGCRTAVLGETGGRAWRLAEMFGAAARPWNRSGEKFDLLIVDDAKALTAHEAEVLAFVEYTGGTLLGLPQPAESVWRLGPHCVEVRGLRGHQFVSRKTGHPVVAGLDPFHFSLWYDHERDRIAHLLDAGLAGEDVCPITLTGKGLWYIEREEIPAGIEKQIGSGRLILDQVRAPERLAGEPRAAIYMAQLLAYAASRRDRPREG